ncbi:MAG: hypothetical protein GKR86_05540 [Ilumatobacter sp.]|nr:hypothetical protein [Ilumatobacter sp.]
MSDPIVTHRTHSTGPSRIMGRVRRPLRRHASSQADDRSHLECVGWRTTLEYRENNHRDFDGVLTGVEQRWRGDAERFCLNGSVIVLFAVGPTPFAVWRRLRVEAEVMGLEAEAQGDDQHIRGFPCDNRRFSRQRLARAE